jgi:UTP--glucose-1-phosphate uridylyltransferase
MKIRKAVFPAAGLGTRFLPATKSQPKEMLPLVDKPVIQYVIEEEMATGIDNIIIVTGRGKNAIEDHFDVSYELKRSSRAGEDRSARTGPSHFENGLYLSCTPERGPGLGHAIWSLDPSLGMSRLLCSWAMTSSTREVPCTAR